MVIDPTITTGAFLGTVALQYPSPALAAPDAAVLPFLGRVGVRHTGVTTNPPNASKPLLGEVYVVTAGPNGHNGPLLGLIDEA